MTTTLMGRMGIAVAWLTMVACGPTTRVAIRNEAPDPVTVSLRSAEAQVGMRFSDVPSRGASPLQQAPFSALGALIVDVRTGSAKSGKVNLERGADNIIVLRSDADPTVVVPGRPPASAPPTSPAEGAAGSEPAPPSPPAPSPQGSPPAEEMSPVEDVDI